MAEFDRLPAVERDLWIAEWRSSRLECPQCHRPLNECTDPTRKFYPYRLICYASMEKAAAESAVDALRGENSQWHDGTFTSWTKERDAGHPYPAGAGESIGVADTDLAPWDDFTTQLNASPVPPSLVAEQPPSNENQPSDEGQDDDPGRKQAHPR